MSTINRNRNTANRGSRTFEPALAVLLIQFLI
jgi:hypothetical protein